jgi:aryl-alcohol dehydrogenase-like predicted oxidoreductase
MKFRTLPETDIRVSEIGFGLWTISTGWWGQFTEGEAIALMHKALDLGITLFDAADTYGNGLSEELIAKAFPKQRDQIVIATKVGYNFYDHGNERRGQREIPQDFSVSFIREAVEKALKRLGTDHIDILQLHNIRMPGGGRCAVDSAGPAGAGGQNSRPRRGARAGDRLALRGRRLRAAAASACFAAYL